MGKKNVTYVWGLLICIYIFFNFAYTSFFPFETMYLTHLGYKSADVAILSVSTAIGNFLFQFVVSFFLRKQKRLGDVMMCFVALSIPFAFLLLLFHQSIFFVVLFVFPVTLFDFSCIGQLDGITVSLSKRFPEIEYSITRIFGSLAGVMASFFLGRLYNSIGINWMFVVHGCIQICTLICLVIIRRKFASDVVIERSEKSDIAFANRFSLLKKALPVIIGGTMVFLGWRAIFVYLPIIIESLGGTSSDFGNAMAIINASSMLALLIYPFIRKKIGLTPMIIIGSTAMAIRWTLTAIAPSLSFVIWAQALDSIGFGFSQPAVIEIISSTVSKSDRDSLISIWTGTQMAFGTILANIVVQCVSKFAGLQSSFVAFSLLAILGCIMVLGGYFKNRTYAI